MNFIQDNFSGVITLALSAVAGVAWLIRLEMTTKANHNDIRHNEITLAALRKDTSGLLERIASIEAKIDILLTKMT